MCARYFGDQSKLVVLYESGTYGVASGNGVWPGLVQSFDITENQNVIQTRYVGQGNRNVGIFHAGPEDIEGTMTFFPQDWRFLAMALGSVSTTSGTAQTGNYLHSISEKNSDSRHNAFTSGTFNPWFSFTLEESRTGPTSNQNHLRTFKGCVANSYALTINQSEPVSVEVGLMAQSGSWFSGTSTSVTAGSNRAYLWSDASLALPTSTTQESLKSATFTINNNFEGPHYINGSRVIQVPYPVNRDYTFEATQDLESTQVGSLYNTYFKGGSTFNAQLDINNTANTGSHRLTVYFSGCRMVEMTTPGVLEGVQEVNYTFVPGSVYAIAHDRLPLYTPF